MAAFKYFWITSIIFWLLVIYLKKPRPADKTWDNQPDVDELALFRKRAAIAICLPQLFLGILDIFSGYPQPISMYRSPDLSNPLVILYFSVPYLLWIVFLWWLWTRDGHIYLSRFAPVYDLPSNPDLIRWFFTVSMAISIFFTVNNWHVF